MVDQTSISSSSPQGSRVSSPGKGILKDLSVITAPPPADNEKSNQPRQLQGRITAYNTKSQELHVATDQGEVVVKSKTPLPPNTDVRLELYIEKQNLKAKIAVERVQNQTADEVTKTIKPAPIQPQIQQPVDVGAQFPAILIPNTPPPTTTPVVQPQQPLPVIPPQFFEQLPPLPELVTQWPKNIPVPKVLQSVLTAPDPYTVFEALPVAQKTEIFQFIAKTEVQNVLTTWVSDEILSAITLQPTTVPQTVMPDAEETIFPAPRPLQNTLQNTKVEIAGQPAQKQPPLSSLISAVTDLIPMLSAKGDSKIPDPMPQLMGQKNMMATLHNITQQMPQNMYQITITNITVPKDNTPPIIQTKDGMIQGVVTHKTPAGFPVIKTDMGDMVIQTEGKLDIGTEITFTATPMTQDQILSTLQPAFAPLPVTPTEMQSPAFDILRGKTWPALDEVVQTLSQMSPDMATTLKSALPQTGPKMTPTTLFFLAALRTGMVENWMGSQMINTLRQNDKKGLIEKLAGDFLNISQQSKTTLSGEWRAISIPLFHDENIHQMQFFLRQQPDPDADDSDDNVKPLTRFILNLHLSRMGEMQLDGLLNKKNFDLILRSEDKLPLEMRQDLMKAFTTGLNQVNMEGGIRFQTRQEKWIDLIPTDPHEMTV